MSQKKKPCLAEYAWRITRDLVGIYEGIGGIQGGIIGESGDFSHRTTERLFPAHKTIFLYSIMVF